MSSQESTRPTITCPKCGSQQPHVYRACWLCGASFRSTGDQLTDDKPSLTSAWDRPAVVAVVLGLPVVVMLAAMIAFLQACGILDYSR